MMVITFKVSRIATRHTLCKAFPKTITVTLKDTKKVNVCSRKQTRLYVSIISEISKNKQLSEETLSGLNKLLSTQSNEQ